MHTSAFSALCTSRGEAVSPLETWVPMAGPWSALHSRLGCLSGKQELVGSMDNPLASPRWLLSVVRLVPPHPGGLQGAGCWGW